MLTCFNIKMADQHTPRPSSPIGHNQEDSDDKPKRKQLDMVAINNDMSFRLNVSYIISAGTVTFHPGTKEVLLVLNKKYQEDIWQLPKGRRNMGEDIRAAAIRETYEETGYRVTLVPVRLPTRATRPRDSPPPSPDGSAPSSPVSVSRSLAVPPNTHNLKIIDDLGTEPLGMVMHTEPQASTETQVNKYIFFYLAELTDPEMPPDQNTQDKGEGLEARWMSLLDARLSLRFDAEKQVLLRAAQVMHIAESTLENPDNAGLSK